ncbi:MAG: ATP-dependent Clp protease adaptor ClpS [Elusimicrobiota bacterium]
MPVLLAKAPTIKKVEKPIDTSIKGFGYRTVLFNDDVHTFEEVATQLMKAIRCSYSDGVSIANVVHSTGSAVVYTGHIERCEAVAMVLENIGLKTRVEK